MRMEMKSLLPVNSCFSTDCRCQSERIHLPVADKCDAGCYFCQYRQNGNVSASPMPGHAAFIPYGSDAIADYLRKRLVLYPDCRIVGVSGPGDILTSAGQLRELLAVLKQQEFSHLYGCICTNGWHFFDALELLVQWERLQYITVTVNTIRADSFRSIYGGEKDFQSVLDNQSALLAWAAKRGARLKINTVFNRYNQQEIPELWRYLQDRYPITVFNLLLEDVPNEAADQKARRMESFRETMALIDKAEFPVKKNCRHCRSDSYGKW